MGVANGMTDVTGMLRGRDILCFSNDWSGDPLSKNHLMRLLAKDNRVLWVNSIGCRAPTISKADMSRALKKLAAAWTPVSEVEPNIFVMNPLAVPIYGQDFVRTINRHYLRWQVKRAMRRLGFQRPVNWIFNPAAAVIAGTLGEDVLIYHCVDEYGAFSGVSARAMAEFEEHLLKQADLTIVSADLLLRSRQRLAPNAVLVRHGVDHAHFRRALDPEMRIPDDMVKLPKPIIGFFGLIADWVDIELLARVARHFPHGSLVLLGKATTDVSLLKREPNVYFLGRKPYASLPAYCKGFDVALMPFRINELTLNANPLKVREYLAAGLQVVSTNIPEVEAVGRCRMAVDHDAFIREVEDALKDPGPSVARSETMRGESWESKLDEIRTNLAACLQKRPALLH